MLADRTNNASPLTARTAKTSLLQSSQHATENGRTSRSETSWTSEADKKRQEEDEELLKKLRDERSRIPSLVSKFEEVFGSNEERSAGDSAVLKKIPPDHKQQIASKVMEYLRQETSRLSEGYKKLRSQRDNLQQELQGIQSVYDTNFEKSTQILSRLKLDKSESIRKMQELEAKCLNDRLQSARAKAGLAKEAEAVAKAEAAMDSVNKSLKMAQEQLTAAQLREKEAQKRAESAEIVVKTHGRALQTAKDELMQLQKMRLLGDAKHAEVLETESAKWNQRLSALDQELAKLNERLRDTIAQEEKIVQETAQIKSDNQRKDAQLESLRERALDAEQKLNQKDGNVNLALQTLRQAQEFNETRIETLNKEKARLESKIEELANEKQTCTEKLYETNVSLERVKDRVEMLKGRSVQIETKIKEADTKLQTSANALEAARTDAATKTAKYCEAKDELERAIEQLNVEREKARVSQQELTEAKALEQVTEDELAITRAAFEKVKSSPTKMNRLLEETKAEENLRRQAGDAAYYKQQAEQLKLEIAGTKKKLFESDAERRSLLNEVQNLKGNIRVIARVRPPSSSAIQATKNLSESDRSQLICSVDCMNMTLELRGNQQRRGSTSMSGSSEVHAFSFNRVFDRETSQHAVFDEVSSFVQSALDGYNVCLFSYGQTGSGKTWTMTGDLANQLNRGIIPRSVDHILYSIAQMREKGWTYDIECSFLEIYNENIRDLLAVDPKQEKNAKHDILHRGKNVVVTNIRRVPVQEAEEVQALLEQADKFRSVAMTDKNAESSRSHSIFTIHLVGRSADKAGAELVGSLSLCDLAGSERLKSSHATGDRLKETQAINTSLSALATVFTSLSQKSPHIPFRNSTLTHILSPCLSGEGKTLMIVNLSSDHDDAQESLCSLRFAQQVNKTELGKAKKNVRDVVPAPPAVAASTAIRGRNNSYQ